MSGFKSDRVGKLNLRFRKLIDSIKDDLVAGFVFTPEEKRVLIFILSAFLLGVASKEYRARHPVAPAAQKIALKSRPQHPAQPENARQTVKKQKTEAFASD